jgi:hypothetical protein
MEDILVPIALLIFDTYFNMAHKKRETRIEWRDMGDAKDKRLPGAIPIPCY